MSEGPRLPLAVADRLAEQLFARWELDPRTCFVVGSVRRRQLDVGDLEIVAPLPKGDLRKIEFADDPVFERINITMENCLVQTTGLFGDTRRATLAPVKPIGRAIRGLKPGFRAAFVEIVTTAAVSIPVQVLRYTPENFGWMMIETTGTGGPKGFGAYFLECWKKRHGITLGEAPASVANHLVDRHGNVVPVPTEEEAFKLCGFKEFVPPERRAAFADAVWKGRESR